MNDAFCSAKWKIDLSISTVKWHCIPLYLWVVVKHTRLSRYEEEISESLQSVFLKPTVGSFSELVFENTSKLAKNRPKMFEKVLEVMK
jgi:hypothetical protein